MEPETWVAITASLIALAALYFTGMSAVAAHAAVQVAKEQTKIQQLAARTAEEQTEIQRQLRIDAAQPYVWADIRPDDAQGFLLNLHIGNSGPTIAETVRIKVEPPLPTTDHFRDRVARAEAMLAQGLRSLTPGRTLIWPLGGAPDILDNDKPVVYTFTVEAEGPFGPVPELTYVVDMSDWRETSDIPTGSLHELTRAVKEVVKRLDTPNR